MCILFRRCFFSNIIYSHHRKSNYSETAHYDNTVGSSSAIGIVSLQEGHLKDASLINHEDKKYTIRRLYCLSSIVNSTHFILLALAKSEY